MIVLKRLLFNSFSKTRNKYSNYGKAMEKNPTWTALDYMNLFLLTNKNPDYRWVKQEDETDLFKCNQC